MDKTNFVCSNYKCNKRLVVGRLRAKYTCPYCGNVMVISRQDKSKGHKDLKKD